jgi:hypothetical protein
LRGEFKRDKVREIYPPDPLPLLKKGGIKGVFEKRIHTYKRGA